MANIEGIRGFVQPGVFARDVSTSRGVSIPGGVRIACIMGEGLREEVIVQAAIGDGQDGNADCSPTGEALGRFFSLQNAPVVSGRTELYLNGSQLSGLERTIDSNPFSSMYDFRIDIETGCIELQGARIKDQGGKSYSASSLNVGNGYVVDGDCNGQDLVSILDANSPAERWTVKATSVLRDSGGQPIPGQTSFTVSGSVSGQLRDSGGQPYIFHDTYYTANTGAASGSDDACSDGFIVASSVSFGAGDAQVVSGDLTTSTATQFVFSGNLISQGQALVGDTLCVDGYVDIEITDISYDSGTSKTTLTLKTDSLDASILTNSDWEIRATNLFVDDHTVAHNATTGVPATEGQFNSSHVGKVLLVCDGTDTSANGLYRIDAVTSSRRLRVSKLSDSSLGFENLVDLNSDGLYATGLTFHILETNGVLVFGIKYGTIPFEVGDKFFIDVDSKVLKKNDKLEARYIAETDINDPEVFTSAQELFKKHGRESLTNTLSLGARMAFENGAPFVLALQCKPPLPRKTTVTLLEEGTNGFKGGSQADDFKFVIPKPSSLGSGKPDSDTQVSFFSVRNGVETQIFPNKVPFYNSAYESPSGQTLFVTGSATDYAYTVINTDTKITGTGVSASIDTVGQTFTTTEIDFDASHVGQVIVVTSLFDTGTRTSQSDISEALFGSGVTTEGVELQITSIVNDSTVMVQSYNGGDPLVTYSAQVLTDVNFFIKDASNTTDVSAAVLFSDKLYTSGALQYQDGLKIVYQDQTDADFFDSNWFEAFEALESEECQIVVPLPLQNRSGIFRAAIQHCETMSTISIQKERLTFFGAQRGLTADALIGNEEIAIEDVGVLEGIQGDDPEEVLDGNTEDLVNYKLSDNFTSNRSVYFFPDEIVRPINGTNTKIDGFYMAAAAAGYLSATQNVAIPLTNKVLSGFSILRDRKYRPVILNQLGGVGATVVQPVTGGGRVLAGRTTSQNGVVEDEEISIMFIRDTVKQVVRDGMKEFVGGVETPSILGVMTSKVIKLLSGLVSQGLIKGFEKVRVEKDKIDPRQINVYFVYNPAPPINYVYITAEIQVV